LPANDLRFTNALLLTAATHELREGCAPLLSQARTEHLVYPYSQPVTSGQPTYRMPPRAVGGSLRDVGFRNTDGQIFRLRQLSADELETIGRVDNQGTPYAYWMQGYKVVLVGVPNVSGTLSTPYYARPNTLVLPSVCVACSDATYTNGTLELLFSGTPPGTLDDDGIRTDVVRATPGFETLVENAETTVEETSPGVWAYRYVGLTEDPGVVAGDFVCVAGQAPVPQLPVEMHGLLAVRTTRRLLKAVGDDRWQALEADVQELEDRAKNWLAPRVSGDTQQAGGSIGNNGIVGGMGWAFGWY
jgi:hypothetical protein